LATARAADSGASAIGEGLCAVEPDGDEGGRLRSRARSFGRRSRQRDEGGLEGPQRFSDHGSICPGHALGEDEHGAVVLMFDHRTMISIETLATASAGGGFEGAGNRWRNPLVLNNDMGVQSRHEGSSGGSRWRTMPVWIMPRLLQIAADADGVRAEFEFDGDSLGRVSLVHDG